MRRLFATAMGFVVVLAASQSLVAQDIDTVTAGWAYPGAREILAAGKPSQFVSAFDSADSPNTILKFYANRFGFDPKELADSDVIGAATGKLPGGASCMIMRSASVETHRVDGIVVTHTTPAAVTSVVIQRAREETVTRVTITRVEIPGK